MSEIFRIINFDTTCRDGAQALPETNQFPVGSKVEIARRIANLGIETIEAGFPATPGDYEEVSEVARTVGQEPFLIEPKTIIDGELESSEHFDLTPIISGLARAVPEDIETTWSAVSTARNPGIHTFVATADEHIRVKHPTHNHDGVRNMAANAVRKAREIGGSDTRVQFSCEAASTSDMNYLESVVKAVLQQGADVINLPDTLGAASAKKIQFLFANATKWLIDEGLSDRVILSAHNHNDGARAVANTIAAAHAVADTAMLYEAPIPTFQAEVTNGPDLGERSGNTNFAPWALDVLVDHDEFAAKVDMRVDTTKILDVARFVAAKANIAIPPKTPVVGSDWITHRSGIHSDAVVKGGARLYAHVNPAWFGWSEAGILEDGKYQGKNGKANLGTVEEYVAS